MPRISWFDDKAEHPMIQEQISTLDSFTSAMADGVVSEAELSVQERRGLRERAWAVLAVQRRHRNRV